MWETEVVFFIYAKNIYCPLCLVSDTSPYKIEGELRRGGARSCDISNPEGRLRSGLHDSTKKACQPDSTQMLTSKQKKLRQANCPRYE